LKASRQLVGGKNEEYQYDVSVSDGFVDKDIVF